jgi:Rha family phage regulatory protein
MSREVIEAAVTEFEAAGCKVRLEMGGKHPKVFWTAPGHDERFMICAGSASDFRAVANQRSLARRMLREIGVLGEDAIAIAPAASLTVHAGRASCTSLDLAANFGKAHKDVLRAIDKIRSDIGPEFDRRNFTPITYTDQQGRSYRAFNLSRDGFVMVAMGFTGSDAAAWKARYIDAFNAMEAELLAIAAGSVVQIDPAVASLRGDLEALTDIVLSLPEPARQRRAPWVNPVHAYRAQRAERQARRAAR